VRRHVPFIAADTVMYPHIEAVRRLVASGAVVAAVDAAMRGA
jgi:hypothetical protein